METNLYNQKGESAGKIKLSEKVFGLPWNADLVHQVTYSMASNQRVPIAHTKNRGEVSGSGIKPWKQKGTGRARHGSRQSPIWVGGGVTFGPRNDTDFSKKINRKMNTKALYTVLSQKLKDNEIIFVDAISLSKSKTKEANGVIKALGGIKDFEKIYTKRNNKAIISLAKKDSNLEKSFRNISGIKVSETRNLNILDILKFKYLVIVNPVDALVSFKA